MIGDGHFHSLSIVLPFCTQETRFLFLKTDNSPLDMLHDKRSLGDIAFIRSFEQWKLFSFNFRPLHEYFISSTVRIEVSPNAFL